MSGISSSIGLVSGLNSSALIEQLLALDARPKAIAQQRLVQLQSQQAALLDVNSKLSALRTAATGLRTNNAFGSATVTSSRPETLTASARAGAAQGTYSFTVDRVVSTQQFLSRGFVDRNSSAAGIRAITVEPATARLDTDTSLSELNGGNGISRGKVVVTDSTGATATVDLSRAATVNEVLDAFNGTTGVRVRASVEGGKLVLQDQSNGSGSFSVASASGFTTAETLGIAKSSNTKSISGDLVYKLGDLTSTRALNDGNGIRLNTNAGGINPDFTIKTRDGGTYKIDLGDVYSTDGATKLSGPAGTIAQIRERIAAQTENKVSLGISADGRSLTLTDSTTGSVDLEVVDESGAAADLGLIATSNTGTISGRRIFAGLNSTLASGLNGGRGIGNGQLNITARDGTQYNLDLSGQGSVSEMLSQVSTATNGAITAKLNDKGTGVILTDTTVGSGNLIVAGGAAAALGLETDPAGVASSTINGARAKRGYVALSTPLSALNNGQGVGIGTFSIKGPNSDVGSVRIDQNLQTVGQLIDRINQTNVGVKARINDDGNGILIEKDPSVTTDSSKIEITDTTGATARALNLAGTAKATGTDNKIDGSQRRVVEVGVGETLDSAVTKLNAARAGITANVLSDGSSGTGYRLRLSSNIAGAAGRMIVESEGTDLGLFSTGKGEDARVFFGSDDPARAILVSRSSNTLEGLIEGVTINAVSASSTPVSVSVTPDTESLVSDIQTFVTTFNTMYSRLNELTRYNSATEKKGVLLGDSVASQLRQELQSIVTGRTVGSTGQYSSLGQLGIVFGKDGQLTLNESKLRQALSTDPQSVADAFSASVANERPAEIEISPGVKVRNTAPITYSKLGVLERLGQLADRYLTSGTGVLTKHNENIAGLITAQNKRLTDFDQRLADKQEKYQNQFATLEGTLSKLRNQQNSLSSIAALAATQS